MRRVKGLRLWPVAAGRLKLGQPDPGGAGEGGQQPRQRRDEPGTARRLGSGKRDGKVYVRNQRLKPLKCAHQLEPGGSGLGGGACPVLVAGNSLAVFMSSVREATRKVCGVLVAMPQGYSWTPPPSSGSAVNVGTARRRPADQHEAGGRAGTSSADSAGRDGACVVVRGRESRLHGEGGQRVRSRHAARPGGRR